MSGGLEFSRQLLRLALGQLLKDAGFDGTGAIPLGVLVDVAERFLQLLGRRAADFALEAGHSDVSLFDAMSALSSMSVSNAALSEYFLQWGLRVPAKALQQQQEQQRTALLGTSGSSGNAILDAILGIKKDDPSGTSEKNESPVEEISGFFRMEPGPFPLDVDAFLERDYDISQKVPESSLFPSLDREGDEHVLLAEQHHPFSRPRPFSESVYFRGNADRYRGLGLLPPNSSHGTRLKRDKALAKGRKLFEKAYSSSLAYKPDLESTDRILSLSVAERLFTERLRFSVSLPEISNSGGNMGLLEDFYIASLPDLTGAKRARPVYKDDKREQRREQKALIAAGKLPPEILQHQQRQPSVQLESGATTPMDLGITESSYPGASVQMDLPLNSSLSMIETEPTNGLWQTSETQVEEIKMEESTSWQDFMEVTPREEVQEVAEPAQEIADPVPASTPAPPKILLKMKTSFPAQPTSVNSEIIQVKSEPIDEVITSQPMPPSSPVSSIGLESSLAKDQINCLCSQPGIDYGHFMIACDECGIWFHGDCVGLGPTSIPEGGTWFCHRCITV